MIWKYVPYTVRKLSARNGARSNKYETGGVWFTFFFSSILFFHRQFNDIKFAFCFFFFCFVLLLLFRPRLGDRESLFRSLPHDCVHCICMRIGILVAFRFSYILPKRTSSCVVCDEVQFYFGLFSLYFPSNLSSVTFSFKMHFFFNTNIFRVHI